MNELLEEEVRNTVSTAVGREELLPEQRILREFRIYYGRNTIIGTLPYRIMEEFCQLYQIIENENNPLRKGKRIIAKERTIQLYMKLWKGSKRDDDYLLSGNLQLKEVKQQLRNNNNSKKILCKTPL